MPGTESTDYGLEKKTAKFKTLSNQEINKKKDNGGLVAKCCMSTRSRALCHRWQVSGIFCPKFNVAKFS
jgi:hypothetical protein